MIWLRMGPVDGSCERGNEFSDSMKCWKFFNSCLAGSFSGSAQLHEVIYIHIFYIVYSESLWIELLEGHVKEGGLLTLASP
jgi:hypothetical protein